MTVSTSEPDMTWLMQVSKQLSVRLETLRFTSTFSIPTSIPRPR